MSTSDSHRALTSIVVLTTMVSTFVLAKRLEKCSPKEDKNQHNLRQAVMYLSGTVMLLALWKAFAVTIPQLDKTKLPVNALYHVLALVTVVINLTYLSKTDTLVCTSKGEVGGADFVADKNLIVTLAVLSGVSLILLLKRGLWNPMAKKQSLASWFQSLNASANSV